MAVAAEAKAQQQASTSEPDATQASHYFGFEALIESVASGAIAPLRGRYLLELRARGGRIVRRQDLPAEAFWTAAELRELYAAATAALGDGDERDEALGLLFAALSYRWLAKGEPDPDGFHLERVANFLASYVGEENKYEGRMNKIIQNPLREKLFDKIGRSRETPLDCAIFWECARPRLRELQTVATPLCCARTSHPRTHATR